MRRHVKIKFVDFWPSFDCENNKFADALRLRHDVEVLPRDGDDVPDILFYSRCGCGEHLKYDCVKVYFTGENDFPDFNECDYALLFYNCVLGDRHMRYPLYMLYETGGALSPPALSDKEALGRGFCSVVMRNSSNCDPMRLRIIDAVESYRPLAYGGPYRNNTGGPVAEKIPFIGGYKFNLALENSMVNGYVTEKLLEPLAAATVPVYWGSRQACRDFNPDAFINVGDYDSTDSLVEAIRRIDNDDEEYLRILRAPNFKDQEPVDFDSRLADFLDNIVCGMKRYRVRFGEMAVLHERRCVTVPLTGKRWSYRVMKLFSGRLGRR